MRKCFLRSSEEKVPDDWSSDGEFIVYETLNLKTKKDLWLLPMSGDRQPFPFLQTEFDEMQAQFSSDGKWIAYTSNESGALEVYVQTFPASGGGSGGSRLAEDASRTGGVTAVSSFTLPPIGNSWQWM